MERASGYTLGLMGAGAHYLLLEGFRLADASLVASFEYASLVWAFCLSYLVWGDIPKPPVFVGAGLIVASGLFVICGEWHGGRSGRRPYRPRTDESGWVATAGRRVPDMLHASTPLLDRLAARTLGHGPTGERIVTVDEDGLRGGIYKDDYYLPRDFRQPDQTPGRRVEGDRPAPRRYSRGDLPERAPRQPVEPHGIFREDLAGAISCDSSKVSSPRSRSQASAPTSADRAQSGPAPRARAIPGCRSRAGACSLGLIRERGRAQRPGIGEQRMAMAVHHREVGEIPAPRSSSGVRLLVEQLHVLHRARQQPDEGPAGCHLQLQPYTQIDWGDLMEPAVVIAVPVLVVALVTQRDVVRGLTASAIMG